jgi:hypothetical protein
MVFRTVLVCSVWLCAATLGACGSPATQPSKGPDTAAAAPPAPPSASSALETRVFTKPNALAWRGEPYAGKAPPEHPDLAKPACAFLKTEAEGAQGKGMEEYRRRIQKAAATRGASGAHCLELFEAARASSVDRSKNVEATVALQMIAREVWSKDSAKQACLRNTPSIPGAHEGPQYTPKAADWLDEGWRCLDVRAILSGDPWRFRYAFFVDREAGTFVVAAERLDDPKTLLFVRSPLRGSGEPIVLQRVPTAEDRPLLETAAPGETAAAPVKDASSVHLQGLTMAVPKGWSLKQQPGVATVLSPTGKSGFVFYVARDPREAVPYLRVAEETFGVSFELTLGKVWVAPSGLRFSRSEKQAKANITTYMLLGTAPPLPGSAAGILAVLGEESARADLEAALSSVAVK